MIVPTVAVTCNASDQGGPAVAFGEYTAKLDQTEIYNGFVVPESITVTADANGTAVLNLWPNALGVAGSMYRITGRNPDTGKKFLDANVVVPNNACNLYQILQVEPYPEVSAAQQALIDNQAVLASTQALAVLADDDRVAAEIAAAYALTRSADAALSQYNASLSEIAAEAAANTAAASANAQIAPYAAAAAASANTATIKAGEASASQTATAATKVQIDHKYRGALTADPATRTDGSANQAGDEYFYNGGLPNLLKRFNGSTWQASDINTANLAAPGGVLLVGNATDKRDLAAANGADLVTYLPAYSATGLVSATAREFADESVSVFRFMTAAQKADVRLAAPVLNVTAPIQAALDFAALKGLGVYVPWGNYRVTKLRINAGCRAFWTDGATLTGITAAHEAIIEIGGTFFSTAAVASCKVYGFVLDGGGVARRGIFAASANGCFIFNNHIRNLSPTAPEGGITLHFNSVQNWVYANKIELPAGPDCVGIYCIGQTVDQYAGWMNGSIVAPTNVASHNIIYGNYINSGSHGIAIFGASFNNVYGNTLIGQRDRSIILCPAASYNLVANNQCLDFGSSGIHLAYGCNENTIIGNRCHAFGSNGEAGIQAYISCIGNKITGNQIHCASKYGIYLAIDVVYNSVSDNSINGNITKAGIAIESDWIAVPPALARYSRPNWTTLVAPRVRWNNDSSYGNSITNNTLHELPVNVCAIYLAQIDATTTNQDNIITGNQVKGSAPEYYFYLFENTTNGSFGHVVEQNKFRTFNAAKVFATRGRAHFTSLESNSIFNDKTKTNDVPLNSTTPDAFACDNIGTGGYTAPTTITNFLNGAHGQTITVRMSVFTTVANNANIKLKGAVNSAATDANGYLMLRNFNGVWVEISRTF